ncbi:UNVERIFIED_CONTAM: hypothetical protein FKN15_024694 [Acipenser sinensis]
MGQRTSYQGRRLHPDVVNMIWDRFGRAEMDLIASLESIQKSWAPLGVDAMAHKWTRALLYAFPPIAVLPMCLDKIRPTMQPTQSYSVGGQRSRQLTGKPAAPASLQGSLVRSEPRTPWPS